MDERGGGNGRHLPLIDCRQPRGGHRGDGTFSRGVSRRMLESWYSENLVCPRDKQALTESLEALTCGACDGRYPIVDGLPVMLLDDVEQTQWVAASSLKEAWTQNDPSGIFV